VPSYLAIPSDGSLEAERIFPGPLLGGARHPQHQGDEAFNVVPEPRDSLPKRVGRREVEFAHSLERASQEVLQGRRVVVKLSVLLPFRLLLSRPVHEKVDARTLRGRECGLDTTDLNERSVGIMLTKSHHSRERDSSDLLHPDQRGRECQGARHI
jgi:hypothetical protein